MTDLRSGGQGEYPLSSRVAVVSGGSSGIGAATVRRLAAAGAKVAVGYGSGRDRAEALVSGLPGDGHVALHLPMEDSQALSDAAAEVENLPKDTPLAFLCHHGRRSAAAAEHFRRLGPQWRDRGVASVHRLL